MFYMLQAIIPLTTSSAFGQERTTKVISLKLENATVLQALEEINRLSQNNVIFKLEEAVCSARQNERWRLDYMTLEYEYRQRYLEGKEEGRAEGRERTIQKLHERGDSIASIADIVELDEEEVKRVIDALKL